PRRAWASRPNTTGTASRAVSVVYAGSVSSRRRTRSNAVTGVVPNSWSITSRRLANAPNTRNPDATTFRNSGLAAAGTAAHPRAAAAGRPEQVRQGVAEGLRVVGDRRGQGRPAARHLLQQRPQQPVHGRRPVPGPDEPDVERRPPPAVGPGQPVVQPRRQQG